ncbi:hypothetical protein OIU76_024876 [Salix suchowensis]|nr:hypothetical protein OIU76_024876 [Salix suchowensis]
MASSLGLLEIFLAVAALAIFCCTLGNKKKRLPTNWPLVGMLPDSIRNLHRPGSMFSRIFDILGDGIFNADSHEWKSQRKLAHSLINHQQFQRFLVKSSWNKVERGLIPVLEHVAKQGSVVDLQDVFQRFTFDITSVLVTGFDPGMPLH